MKRPFANLARFGVVLLGLATSSQAFPEEPREYEINVTNLTRGQSFTPILVAVHTDGVSLFTVGEGASPGLAALAEGGEIDPLRDALEADPRVAGTTASEGLLAPGATVSLRLEALDRANRLSVTSMLIPTNDAFFALNAVPLPHGRETVVHRSPAYDAGSEPNDERCAAIPGPVCGGEGTSANAGGEGYVHIHAGIHGIADLVPADRDWRNPVAQIAVRRVR